LHSSNAKKIKLVLAFSAVLLAIIVITDYSTTVLKMIYPLKYKEYVFEYSIKSGIDPYLVFAVIKAESGFDPNARSNKAAMGLMQITEQTGTWGAHTLKMGRFKTDDLYNPEINIRLGCWYLKQLMKEFNNNTDLVITAYNGGSGNVKEWLNDKELSHSGEYLDKIPFKETERFLDRVKNYHSMYRRLYEKDFK
jgi:soluble lytic murein transglycosylase